MARGKRGGRRDTTPKALRGITPAQQAILDRAHVLGNRTLTMADILQLTPAQRDFIGIRAPGASGGGYTPPPGDTRGGTDFSSVPQTPGQVVQTPQGPRIAPIDPPPGGSTPGPSGPQFTPYTPDSIYNDTLADLAARRQRALDAATEGEKGLAGDYGLGIVQDDTGARFSGQWAASDANQGGIDPSNPFSRASLLNKSYFTANKIGEGSYANRGLLTSGAYQRSQQRNAFGFEQGRDQLLRQFASGLQGYRDRRSQAETDASTGGLAARDSLFGRNRDMYDRLINPR